MNVRSSVLKNDTVALWGLRHTGTADNTPLSSFATYDDDVCDEVGDDDGGSAVRECEEMEP